MQSVMLLNPKGGSGKTTIATNLAAHYAGRRFTTTLFDHDAQGCSTRWLQVRDESRPPIHGVAAYQTPVAMTRSWQLRVPLDAQRVVVDTPAGLTHPYLAGLVRNADVIIIPVLPSPIDIDALIWFFDELRRVEPACKRTARIGAVINRVRARTRSVESLENLLREVGLPVVARLRESRRYPRASARGEGIHECKGRPGPSVDDWTPLLAWLEDRPVPEPQRDQARTSLFAARVPVPV